MRRWVVGALGMVGMLYGATVHAAGVIQIGLAGIGLPASSACEVLHLQGTYRSRPVVSCQQGESFFVSFRNLNDASKSYTPEIHWSTPSTNNTTNVVWTWACDAYPDNALDDDNDLGSSTAATNAPNGYDGFVVVNEDTTTGALPLVSSGLGLQCPGSTCAGADVICKITLTTGIGGVGGSAHYYWGATITTADS